VKIIPALFALAGAALAQIGVFENEGDVGANPKTGSAVYDSASGEYRVTGGGENMWGDVDAFHFLWRRISGDATITADLRFIGEGAVGHRKAVLIFRQSLEPDAPYADVALHGDGLTSLQYRTTAGSETQEFRSTVNAPVHLRIDRRGNQFTITVSKEGGEAVTSGPATVTLSDPVYAGIGTCSHNAQVLETAVFSNVRVQPARPPAPRYRSKITVFDTRDNSSRILYTADETWEAPNWTPDGKYLLVNSGGGLYRLPVDGPAPAVPEKLDIAGYRLNNDHGPTRDGKLLAFSASSPSARQSQVYVARSDGRDPRLLTPAAHASYFHGWSPDGKWLSFVGQRNGKFELFRVPVEGGPEQRLTSKGGYDDGPEYSPDGKWIYFNSNRSGGWDIWRMPAAGAGPGDAAAERVTSDELEDWFPHFSPDGKSLIFLSFPKGTAGHDGEMEVQLRMMAAPGKKLKPPAIRVIANIFGGQGTINVNSWAPDSRRFAFVAYEPLPRQ
jgi:Tol biopolymer transport system component